MSETLAYQLKEIYVDSSGLLDHSAVIVRFDYQTIPTGKGRWICNVKDKQCKTRIEWFWNFWITQKDRYDCLSVWWDVGKK